VKECSCFSLEKPTPTSRSVSFLFSGAELKKMEFYKMENLHLVLSSVEGVNIVSEAVSSTTSVNSPLFLEESMGENFTGGTLHPQTARIPSLSTDEMFHHFCQNFYYLNSLNYYTYMYMLNFFIIYGYFPFFFYF
jgi:hypothetical protein